jgi:hypothetical protein
MEMFHKFPELIPVVRVLNPVSGTGKWGDNARSLRWPAEDIADFLCRNVDEVRAKTAEIARGRS